MAAATTATLRVPVELRDEIARLAERRGSTMLDVVSDAIHRLSREEWWESVHHALDDLTPEDRAEMDEETRLLDRTAADGLLER